MMFSILKILRTWKTKKNELIKILEHDRAHCHNDYIRTVAIALTTHWRNWNDIGANTFFDIMSDVEQGTLLRYSRYLDDVGITILQRQAREYEIACIFYSHRDKIVRLIRDEMEIISQNRHLFDTIQTLILPSGLTIPRQDEIKHACHDWKKEGF
jgi:hypothetical protein